MQILKCPSCLLSCCDHSNRSLFLGVKERQKLWSQNSCVWNISLDNIWSIFLCSKQVAQDWVQTVILLHIGFLGISFHHLEAEKVDLFEEFCLGFFFVRDMSASFLFWRHFCVHELKNILSLSSLLFSTHLQGNNQLHVCQKINWKKTLP